MDGDDELDFPWPVSGVDPFRPDLPTSPPALLEDGPRAWHFVAIGFQFSAQSLIEKFRDTGHDQDFLALPTVYLYRHALEVSMKGLIAECYALQGKSVPVSKEHDLRKLWKTLRALLRTMKLEGPPQDANAVEELLGNVGNVDPDSMAFRYPVDLKGKPMLPAALKRFDLLHFAERVDGLLNWLDGTASMLDQQRDFQADYPQDWG